MMKEVLVIVILLTLSQVSFGKAQTTSLQTESSSRSCTREMSEMPNKKIICVVEYRKKSNNDNALLPQKRENLSKMSAIKNMSGKQVKNLLSKKMANLLYALSVEEFSVLRIKTDSLSGTKDITTPFVSYYPGLLNEKIL